MNLYQNFVFLILLFLLILIHIVSNMKMGIVQIFLILIHLYLMYFHIIFLWFLFGYFLEDLCNLFLLNPFVVCYYIRFVFYNIDILCTIYLLFFDFLFFLDLGLKMYRQHSQRRCHILVLHQDVRRHIQMGGGKIPDSLHTQINKLLGNCICL